MKKFILLMCLVLLAAYQIEAVCDDDYDKICGQRSMGTFPYDCDKSCTKFIICFNMNDKPKGLLKLCPSGQYYDSSHRICTDHKPDYCS
ncbi:uncharacterized protein LOC119613010 [Lucilia sericata]|uniref:uncharacterized protein LOC119613010 n=1 Tax=Lucilia sericata TaxID=13632 RepID=UPI0018A86FE7|nr:uncharacterized protein LOC119613010 [Lucilia sericata]